MSESNKHVDADASAKDIILLTGATGYVGGRLLPLLERRGVREAVARALRNEDQGTSSTIRQTALFDPVGLFGLAYWYALFPLHQYIFAGMLRNIARATEKPTRLDPPSHSSNGTTH